jgi:hypothetical protein
MIMHDWTLRGLSIDWTRGTVRLELSSSDGVRVLTAAGLKSASVPRRGPWGPSSSINGYRGPFRTEDGTSRLVIEMQSGDVIELVADEFVMPEDA